MKKSDVLKKELNDLLNEAQVLNQRSEREGRELSPQEHARWSAIMTEETGEVAILTKAFEATVKKENETSRLRSTQGLLDAAPIAVYDQTGGGPAGGYSSNTGFNWGQGPHVVLPKLTAFKGGGNPQQAQRDAYDCGLWVKANIMRDPEARRTIEARRGASWVATLNETDPTSGGYLVPSELSSAIFVAWEQSGAIPKLARIIPMGSDNLAVPKNTAGTTVVYAGEEGSISPSGLTIGRVECVAKKRSIFSLMSNEVNTDSIVPLMDLLTTDMGHQFGLKQDQEGILGDGTSAYGGVAGLKTKLTAATASISTAASHSTWATLDISDIGACMSALPDKFRVEGQLTWLCSQSFKWQVFDRLSLAAGGALAMVFVNGVPQMYFLGYPVVTSDRMPTTTATGAICAMFGNFGQALLVGQRSTVNFAVSEHYAFQNDQLAIRATTRYDINCHGCGDTSNAGAIVALSTHS